jgi:hypothetical protein
MKGKVIPVQAVEALKVARGWGSHGGKFVSPTLRPLFTTGNILLEAESTPGP